MTDDGIRSSGGPTPLVRSPGLEPGRLSTLAIVAGAAGGIPLPWIPSAVQRRIRGALAHDIAGRRGIGLTPDAREIFAEPSIDGRGKAAGMVAGALGFVARRVVGRLGVVGVVPPVTSGLEAWALGLLLDRYFERVRTSRTVRLDAAEARRVRAAIDRAVVRALSPEVRPPAPGPVTEAPEEMRDNVTQVVDRALLGLAALPSWAQRRLLAAFDEVAADAELGRGA